MPLKSREAKRKEKIVVIEDYGGQKTLWDGKEESSKVTCEVTNSSRQEGLFCETVRDFLCKFTARNYLKACSVLCLSRDKRYTVTQLDNILGTLFHEEKLKTIHLYLKNEGNTPTCDAPFSNDISLHIKDKDRRAVLWNGRHFAYKMKLKLTDAEMSLNLETLLQDHTSLNYLLKNCLVTLLSPKYENLLTPVSLKDSVGSFIIDSSATIYLHNVGLPDYSNQQNADLTADSGFEIVSLPSCSSIEIIDAEEMSRAIPRKTIAKGPNPRPRNGEADPWKKPDWYAIRKLIIDLETNALTTMGYRHVSEVDRRKLVTELWAVNKAFKNMRQDSGDVLCHFKALESVVASNRPGDTNKETSNPHKSADGVAPFQFREWYLHDDAKPKKSRYLCLQPSFIRNAVSKDRPRRFRLNEFVESLQQPTTKKLESGLPHCLKKKVATISSTAKTTFPKCPDCSYELICENCRNKENSQIENGIDCCAPEEDRISAVYIAIAMAFFTLVLVFIFFL